MQVAQDLHGLPLVDWLVLALQSPGAVRLCNAGAPSAESASTGFARHVASEAAGETFALQLSAAQARGLSSAQNGPCGPAWHDELQAAIIGPQAICFRAQMLLQPSAPPGFAAPAHNGADTHQLRSAAALLLSERHPASAGISAASAASPADGDHSSARQRGQHRSLLWGQAQHTLPSLGAPLHAHAAPVPALRLHPDALESGSDAWAALPAPCVGHHAAGRSSAVQSSGEALLQLLCGIIALPPVMADCSAARHLTRRCQVRRTPPLARAVLLLLMQCPAAAQQCCLLALQHSHSLSSAGVY